MSVCMCVCVCVCACARTLVSLPPGEPASSSRGIRAVLGSEWICETCDIPDNEPPFVLIFCSCIALGAFDSEELPVAFIVAELAKLKNSQDFFDQQEGAQSHPVPSERQASPSSGNESTQRSTASLEPDALQGSTAARGNLEPLESSPQHGQVSGEAASALQVPASAPQLADEHASTISTQHFLQSIDCRPDAQVLGIRLLGESHVDQLARCCRGY
eukprot:1160412-Pelagomonas_calceolata.AAC.20